jgi:hypothetical protein
MQEFGGDPVSASVVTDKGAQIPTRLVDMGDGTYEIRNVSIISFTFLKCIYETLYRHCSSMIVNTSLFTVQVLTTTVHLYGY